MNAAPAPRPRRHDPAIRAVVIAKLAQDCAEWEGEGVRATDWVSALGGRHMGDNGYELARDLERYALVSPDAELVEILDGVSSHLWSAHDDAVKAWVAEFDIRPTMQPGARMSCRHGEGTISGIDDKMGRYMFVPDGEEERFANGGGVLIAYEDARGIDARSGQTACGLAPKGESPVAEGHAP